MKSVKLPASFLAMVLIACTSLTADAGPSRRKPSRKQQSSEAVQPSQPATPYTGDKTGSADALDEVNAERAARGLRPFIKDELLTQAANIAAERRASRLIRGHLPESDFSCVPAGGVASAAGCGALEPSWGWGSCCTYDNYSYAGAAWVMGRDGRRYMHLFVR